MTLFEYPSVAVSLMLALGLTHLLANLRAAKVGGGAGLVSILPFAMRFTDQFRGTRGWMFAPGMGR